MFNNSLKKEALRIHKETLDKYDISYEVMKNACERLYDIRQNSVELIHFIQNVVNSIANKPKDYDTKLGKIGEELICFHETEEYGKEAYNASIKAGINILGGLATGMGVASMAPSALVSIATTFGTASTGTAIRTLSGAAAQKAAVAWIGRTFAGIAVKSGAGMAAGNAFLALAGPVGWGITAASTGISLISLSNRNKELANKAIEEAKEIAKARESLDETAEKINSLKVKTELLFTDMTKQRSSLMELINADYTLLSDEKKYFLGSVVNNTLSLSVLLNETIC